MKRIVLAKSNSYLEDSFFTFQEAFNNELISNNFLHENLYEYVKEGNNNNLKYIETFRESPKMVHFIREENYQEKYPYYLTFFQSNERHKVDFDLIFNALEENEIVYVGTNLNDNLKYKICYCIRKGTEIIDIYNNEVVSKHKVNSPVNEPNENFISAPLFYIMKLKNSNVYCLFYESNIISFMRT